MALEEPLLGLPAGGDVEQGENAPPSPVKLSSEAHRHGTTLTASSHIVTAVIGAGILALPYSLAWLGWVAGPLLLAAFYLLTWLNASLLAAVAAASPDRPASYSDVVGAVMGPGARRAIAVLQLTINAMAGVAYTVAAAACARAVRMSLTCHGVDENCHGSNVGLWPEIAAFGTIQLAASQLPSLDDAAWSSALGAITSLIYSAAALGLGLWHASSRQGTATGIVAASGREKALGVLNALGGIAFAFAFPTVLVEVQATIRETPGGRSSGQKMQRAISLSLLLAFLLYLGVGVSGYAAFGNAVLDNVLAMPHIGPVWVLVLANGSVVVHLISAYQVYAQPVFAALERRPKVTGSGGDQGKPGASKTGEDPSLLARLLLRSTYVVVVSAAAALLPCFSQILGLIGALLFWPAGVFFPIVMYIRVTGVQGWRRGGLIALTAFLFVVSVAVAGAAVHGLVVEVMRQ